MWRSSLFSQHYYSVYESSTYNVFCLSIFIASFLAIKPLSAVLYTSEQVRWPDGCSNKWEEMSEALVHTWAVRRTSPAPRCQCRPRLVRAEHSSIPRHEGNRRRDKDHPSRDDHCTGERLLCTAWTIWLCLLRPVPESQNLTKIFSVFSSWMARMAFAINTTPKISKIALNGKLLVGFQNHNLTVLHLILITSITLSAW